MKLLSKVLFWLGLFCIPLSWLVWYLGPEIEMLRPVLDRVQDPVMRAVLQEAHAERWGLFVGLWPVTLLATSIAIEKYFRE